MLSLIDEAFLNSTKRDFVGVATLSPSLCRRLLMSSLPLTGVTCPSSAATLFFADSALEYFPNKVKAANAKIRAMGEKSFIDQIRRLMATVNAYRRSEGSIDRFKTYIE